jgi:hypothetical protein
VYIGSFWDQELVFKDNALLFEMEERDLMRDLRDLPRNRYSNYPVLSYPILTLSLSSRRGLIHSTLMSR